MNPVWLTWNNKRKPIWFYGNDFIGRKDKLFRKASWWISTGWSNGSFGRRSKLKRKCFFTRLRFLNISRLFKYRNGSESGGQFLSSLGSPGLHWPWLDGNEPNSYPKQAKPDNLFQLYFKFFPVYDWLESIWVLIGQHLNRYLTAIHLFVSSFFS